MKLKQPSAQLVAALATLAAILATATAGYLFWQNQELAKLAAEPPTLVYKTVIPVQSDAPSQNPAVAQGDFSGWQNYHNDQYGFEVKYPIGWSVFVSPESDFVPRINIYKGIGSPPFSHFSNVTQVSFFPEGVGSSGPLGEYREIKSIFPQLPGSIIDEYLLSDGIPRAYLINFKNPPLFWGESGYIFASAEVRDEQLSCHNKKLDRNDCNPVEDGLDVSGIVDENDWNFVSRILSTIKFQD